MKNFLIIALALLAFTACSTDDNGTASAGTWTLMGSAGLTATPTTVVEKPQISFIVDPTGGNMALVYNDSKASGIAEDGPITSLLYSAGTWTPLAVEAVDSRADQRIAMMNGDLYVSYRQDSKDAGLAWFNGSSWESVTNSAGEDIATWLDGTLLNASTEWNDPAIYATDSALYVAAQAADNDYVIMVKYDGTDFSFVGGDYVNSGAAANKATGIELAGRGDDDIFVAFDSDDGAGDLMVYHWNGTAYSSLAFESATNTLGVKDIALAVTATELYVGFSHTGMPGTTEDGPFQVYTYNGSWTEFGTIAADCQSDLNIVPADNNNIYFGFRTVAGTLGLVRHNGTAFEDMSTTSGFPTGSINDPAFAYASTPGDLFVVLHNTNTMNLMMYSFSK